MIAPQSPERGQTIGAYVRARRRANRLTQQQLAELAGVGLRFVKDLEHGKPTVRLQSVQAVLAVFGKQLGVVDRPRDAENAIGSFAVHPAAEAATHPAWDEPS
jgi:y4mF family transcriptional regulator